mmetsp:Transcript_38984/g.66515  ORF Transcript_38984/g.66515 Transcript_38984/m.66515 type:complete len:93 (+) Transcript_38984:111-389(+)
MNQARDAFVLLPLHNCSRTQTWYMQTKDVPTWQIEMNFVMNTTVDIANIGSQMVVADQFVKETVIRLLTHVKEVVSWCFLCSYVVEMPKNRR